MVRQTALATQGALLTIGLSVLFVSFEGFLLGKLSLFWT